MLNIETAFMNLWQWVVDMVNTITSLLFSRSQCELHTSSSNLILLSVWSRGPRFTLHGYTVFLPLMHCLFQQLGIIRVETRKEGKPFGMLLHFQHWDLRRVEHSGRWNIKKKNVITICPGNTDYGTVIVRGTLRMLNAQLFPSAFLLCSNSPK